MNATIRPIKSACTATEAANAAKFRGGCVFCTRIGGVLKTLFRESSKCRALARNFRDRKGQERPAEPERQVAEDASCELLKPPSPAQVMPAPLTRAVAWLDARYASHVLQLRGSAGLGPASPCESSMTIMRH